jgi:biopolymer transport protein ExbD
VRRLLRDEAMTARPIAEINMTNLIDVTLTLLILFLLIAPVIDQGFTLELPVAEDETIRADEAMHLSVDRKGRVHWRGKVIGDEELSAKAEAHAKSRRGETDVVILADRQLPYGRVIEVMDLLRGAGLTRLALATKEAGAQ